MRCINIERGEVSKQAVGVEPDFSLAWLEAGTSPDSERAKSARSFVFLSPQCF